MMGNNIKTRFLTYVSHREDKRNKDISQQELIQKLAYPQTMYFIAKFPNPAVKVFQYICQQVGGHELSKTDRGYGGGRYIDRWCRWCDYHFLVPLEESPNDEWMLDLIEGEGNVEY